MDWLTREWREAETRAKKRRLIRFAVLAMNRARVISQNPRVSPAERRESAQVARIYENWLERHKLG